jgi:DNA-binding response OmpR family regulator
MYPEEQEILIVDDDAERRGRIERILTAEGFAVTVVAEGLAALRALGDRHFALIIAGLRLPGSLDGVTTVRQARARQPWLKALFTDHYGSRPSWDNRDTDDFIAAPFERRELIGCVFELLQRGPAVEAVQLARSLRADLRAS